MVAAEERPLNQAPAYKIVTTSRLRQELSKQSHVQGTYPVTTRKAILAPYSSEDICHFYCTFATEKDTVHNGAGIYACILMDENGRYPIIGDIHRFSSAKRLTGYAGLVPSLNQTGSHAYSGHITKAGSPELRWLMVEAARSAVRFDPHWQRVYERLKSRRGSNIAAVAVARKLLVAIWHLLHDRACYFYLRPQSFVRKLQDWAWCIGRDHLPAETSADFVRQCLKGIDLPDLAIALTTNRKGKLIINEAEMIQGRTKVTFPVA
jgi:hypothetical protein